MADLIGSGFHEAEKKFVLVVDPVGRQIMGYVALAEEGEEVLLGDIVLYDPMLISEQQRQQGSQVQVMIQASPLFMTKDVESIKLLIISVLEIDVEDKLFKAYEKGLEDSRLNLRAARSGLEIASSMPGSPVPGGAIGRG